MKFSNKLSFAILMTGMAVLIILSLTIYKFGYNSIIESQFMYTQSIADEVSDDIDLLLSEKVNIALTLASTPIIKNELETSNFFYADQSGEKRKESIRRLNEKWKSIKDPTDKFILKFTDNNVSRFLKDQQAILKGEYGEIFLTNKFGALIASTAKLSTFAHGHKYWWLGSYTDGEGAVFFDDRGYDDSVGGYVLGLVVPIRKGAEIIGILKCNLNILGSVSKLISGAQHKLIGKFKLIRSGGMVVFEEGFEPLSTQVHDSIFEKLKSNNDESFILNDSGEEYLVGFSEIKLTKSAKGHGFGGTFESIDHKKGNTGESWYVLCYRQMSVVLAPITGTIKSIFLIGTAVIVILVLVSQLFGRKIAKPLSILDKATEKIGKGDFEYRIDTKRNDEFGNLALSFNSMANELQQTTTSVELLENEIKHRKQTEKSLKESEERYRSLVELSPEAVFVHQEGIIQYINRSGAEIFGTTNPEELIGKPAMELIHPDFHEVVKSRIERIYNNRITLPFKELKYVRIDKEVIDVEATGTHIEYSGKPATLSVIRDITTHKQAEEEKMRLEAHLNQAQKMEAIATLAGGIAHQFNNALLPISVNLDMLEMQYPDDGKIANYTKQMKDSTHRMAQLTSQLLAYARGGKYQAQIIAINDFMDHTLPLIQHSLNPDVRIETDLTTKTLNIQADQTQMQMLLVAILTNASEAIEDKGFIRITAKNEEIDEGFAKHHPGLKPDHYVCIIVEDDGKGMDKETRDRIFEPFFTTKFEGRGLGMAAAFGIVKNHDGWISVYSEIGRGTVIRIYLPTIEAQEKEPEKSKVEPLKGTGTILIIEDEEMLMEVSHALLEKLGYNILKARTGKEAVDIAKTFDGDIDLAILDLILPDMKGGAIYPLIMKTRPNLKVIVCSGYSIDGPAQAILDAGAQDFIQKPFTVATISAKLNEALRTG